LLGPLLTSYYCDKKLFWALVTQAHLFTLFSLHENSNFWIWISAEHQRQLRQQLQVRDEEQVGAEPAGKRETFLTIAFSSRGEGFLTDFRACKKNMHLAKLAPWHRIRLGAKFLPSPPLKNTPRRVIFKGIFQPTGKVNALLKVAYSA
jgi:hypothetical protein